jgi:hypothetical protein
VIRGRSKTDKERKKAAKELRLLRERLEQLIIEKDEQKTRVEIPGRSGLAHGAT